MFNIKQEKEKNFLKGSALIKKMYVILNAIPYNFYNTLTNRSFFFQNFFKI